MKYNSYDNLMSLYDHVIWSYERYASNRNDKGFIELLRSSIDVGRLDIVFRQFVNEVVQNRESEEYNNSKYFEKIHYQGVLPRIHRLTELIELHEVVLKENKAFLGEADIYYQTVKGPFLSILNWLNTAVMHSLNTNSSTDDFANVAPSGEQEYREFILTYRYKVKAQLETEIRGPMQWMDYATQKGLKAPMMRRMYYTLQEKGENYKTPSEEEMANVIHALKSFPTAQQFAIEDQEVKYSNERLRIEK